MLWTIFGYVAFTWLAIVAVFCSVVLVAAGWRERNQYYIKPTIPRIG